MHRVSMLIVLMFGASLLTSACATGTPASPVARTATSAAQKPAAILTATPTPVPSTPKPVASAAMATPASPKPMPMTLKHGMATATTDAGIILSMELGYFAEQGITVEAIEQKSGADTISAVGSGALDVAGGAFSLAHANAALRSVAFKMVADKFSAQPGFVGYRINYRKDLYDSGQLRDVAQLKGRKIGVASVAAMGGLVAPTLKQANLTLNDVELVPMSFPDMVVALANKSIDAAVLSEPLLTKAVDQGIAVRGKGADGPAVGGIFFSPQFSQNVDAGARYISAYLKGVRAYNEAFTKNIGKKEVVQALAKVQGIDDLTLYDKMDMFGLNPDGYVDKKAAERAIDYWVSTGELKERLDVNKFVDDRFVEVALQKLGKYVR